MKLKKIVFLLVLFLFNLKLFSQEPSCWKSVEVYTVLKIDERNYLEKNPTFLDIQMGDEYYE